MTQNIRVIVTPSQVGPAIGVLSRELILELKGRLRKIFQL